MSIDTPADSVVQFIIVREGSQVIDISTNPPRVNNFLDLIKMNRAYNTWVSYAHDLKIFFTVLLKPPEAITRADCVILMKRQDQTGCSDANMNLVEGMQILTETQPSHRHRAYGY